MKFLDLTGLTYFFNKVKTWIHLNYLSLNDGGTIQGSVSIIGESGLNINEHDEHSQRYVNISYINGISIGTHYDEGNRNEDSININQSYISAPQFKKTNGKSTQALIADGSVKEIGSANGIAGLDANGYVPLSQLGNLDTTVAEVVTALPTTNIKKHIYLIRDTDGVTQNQYKEYIYTGDTSATYDASKWEKLGDFRATVDLADYAKKSEAIGNFSPELSEEHVALRLYSVDEDNHKADVIIDKATNEFAGVMTSSDKIKLDGIANNANNYSLPTASSTIKGGITLGYSQNDKNYPVALDDNGKAYVNIPWTDTNTTYGLATPTNDGLMSKADKTKVDSIDTTYAKKNEAVASLEITAYENNIQCVLKDVNGSEMDWPTIDPATSTKAGIMKPADKVKLDGIALGATADSAITTAEIDALFT